MSPVWPVNDLSGLYRLRDSSKYRRNQLACAMVSGYVLGMTKRKGASSKGRGSSEPEQLPLWTQRGGKRPRSGRKVPRGRRASSPHRVRPELVARHPVHVVLRVIRDVGNLRRRFTYKAIREATLTAALRE